MLSEHLETRVTRGGVEHRVVAGDPIAAEVIDAASKRLGWPLPDDYRTSLARYGEVDVFGARLLHPSEWRARAEPLDREGRLANYLPFARRAIPTGGELLFAFRFEATLLETARGAAAVLAGEDRPAFLGFDYVVVACHLPQGLSGARLEASQRAMAPTFSAWVDALVAMLGSRG